MLILTGYPKLNGVLKVLSRVLNTCKVDLTHIHYSAVAKLQ